jgi:hypothetical protein
VKLIKVLRCSLPCRLDPAIAIFCAPALQRVSINSAGKTLGKSAIEKAKNFKPILLTNNDTAKLLANSSCSCRKKQFKAVLKKKETTRAVVFLQMSVKLKSLLATSLETSFEKTIGKNYGLGRLAKWHEKVDQSGF